MAEILGALNESKELQKITYSVPRMLTWQGVEPDLVKDASRKAIRKTRKSMANGYVRKMRGLFNRARTVGLAGVDHDLRMLVHDTFQRSRELGFKAMGRVTALDRFDIATIKAAADEEYRYAKKFLDDYLNDRGTMPYDKRFNQYGQTVKHQFNMAAYQSAPHGTRIFWEMASIEPCPDCPELAAGSPYTTDLGNKPLPTVPQAGETQCCGNCKCYLRFEYEPYHIGTEPDMSYEVAEFEGSPVDLTWLRSRHGKKVQRDLDNMFRRTAHHRQLMDAHPYDSDIWRYHKRMRDSWNGKMIKYQNQHGIRATPRASVSEFLSPAESLIRQDLVTFIGPSGWEGQGAVLRGLRVTPGELSKISKNNVRIRMADGRTRILTHGDDAGASLWGKTAYCDKLILSSVQDFTGMQLLEMAQKCVMRPRPPTAKAPRRARKIPEWEKELPATLTDAERETIRRLAWKPAQTWDLKGAGFGRVEYKEQLENLINILKIPEEAYKTTQRMFRGWQSGQFREGSAALRHLSGRTTTYRSSIGYADKEPGLINAIKAADKKDFIEFCAKYGVGEADVRKAVAIDQYFSQQVMKEISYKTGKETITLYRGVTAEYFETQGLAREVGAKLTVETNSLSSWSTRKDMAQFFAGSDGLVLKTTIEREAVAFGELSFGVGEGEFILRGGKYSARVLKGKYMTRLPD